MLEDGKRTRREEGTPQGRSASPLLANVYLRYVFDLWVQAWRQKRAHGDVIVARFADDIVVGFNSKADADQFRTELTERMTKFHWNCIPRKRGCWRLVRSRSITGKGVEKEAGNVQLSWLYAHVREEEEQWTVHGAAANDPQTVAGEAERGENLTSATDVGTNPRRR